jgi:uncharacterized membrane protein (UPF0136 family)
MDTDYIASIVAGLIIYGVICVAAGYWLRRGIDQGIREIFHKNVSDV